MDFSDTNPQAEKIIVEGFRAMPVWRKLELLSQMVGACRILALAGLRRRIPFGQGFCYKKLTDGIQKKKAIDV